MRFHPTLQRVREYLRRGRAARRPPKRSRRLEFDRLEERLAPVVGATTIPDPIARGAGYDGVVKLWFAPGGACSGSLLRTGRHILTAAHCMDGNNDGVVDVTSATVQFDMPARTILLRDIPAARMRIAPGWPSESRDLAIIELPEIAPAGTERYQIYTGSAELGQVITMVGYGCTGTGASGGIVNDPFKRLGDNRFDELSAARTVLSFDFDSGLDGHNRMGSRTPVAREALFCFGDSGGPAFLGGQIAGVNHWLTWFGTPPVRFGDIGSIARVSTSAGWINTTIGGPYDLVLDMNNQPAGNNGLADTIIAERVGDLVNLRVNGTLVHSDLASNVRSLAIRGSGDQDTITVDAPGNNKPVTIDGRGGNDSITAWSPWANTAITPWTIYGGAGNDSVLLRYINANTSTTVYGGDQNDTLTVQAAYSTVRLNGEAGDDTFVLRNSADNLGEIARAVYVDGGASGSLRADTLRLVNTGIADPTNYRITPTMVDVTSWSRTISHYSNLDGLELHSGNGGDTAAVEGTASRTSVFLYMTGGNDTVYVRDSASAVTVWCGLGNDTVNVGNLNSLAGVRGRVTAHGEGHLPGGRDVLNLYDQAYSGGDQYTVTRDAVTVAGLPSFRAEYDGLEQVVLNTGSGDDIVNVRSTAAGTPVTLYTGAGNDTVNIGSGGPPPNASTINAILADVFVYGEGHRTGTPGDVLNVYDQSNPHDPARTYEIGAAGLDRAIRRTGPPVAVGRIIHNTVEDVHLYPSSSVNVHSTAAGVTTTVHGGPNDDVITVDDGNHTLNGIQGRLLLHGGGGNDQVNLHDYSNIVAQTYTLTSETVARTGIANISYYTAEQLLLRAGIQADTIQVTSTRADTPVTVQSGAGDDTITVGDATYSLSWIAATLTIDGGDHVAGDALTVNDGAASGRHTYGLNGLGELWRDNRLVLTVVGGPAPDYFSTVENLSLTLSRFDDFINVTGVPRRMPVSLNAGAGGDVLTGGNMTNVFSITGTDAGRLHCCGSDTTFSQVENLLGGLNDQFVFFAGGSLSGSIDGNGAGGSDTLDYSSYGAAVLVNLPFGTATAIAGGISNIQNVTGGAGHDLLVGDQFSNVLEGGPGQDVLIGGGIDWTTYAYSFLPDVLSGGTGDDLEIAGFTIYDADASWIRDIWAYAVPFADRVSWLQPWLDPTWAVYTNYGGNQLTGGAGDDWFFANLASAWGEPVDVIFDLSALEDTFRVELP